MAAPGNPCGQPGITEEDRTARGLHQDAAEAGPEPSPASILPGCQWDSQVHRLPGAGPSSNTQARACSRAGVPSGLAPHAWPETWAAART